MENGQFGSKIKIPKNVSKSILQIISSCSVQKTARKNTKYSRNETILKIGHHAKGIFESLVTSLFTFLLNSIRPNRISGRIYEKNKN